jgi:gliding motility-associated-like protein
MNTRSKEVFKGFYDPTEVCFSILSSDFTNHMFQPKHNLPGLSVLTQGPDAVRAVLIQLSLFFGMLLIAHGVCAQEICNNGVDDDGDALIDLNDTADCECGVALNEVIPNPSFEEFDCVPNFFTQMNCAENWVQATSGTSDFYLNSNGGFWTPVIPAPVPDGSGLCGFHSYEQALGNITYTTNEYIGTCLLSPMEAGVTYTLQMDVAGIAWNNFQNALGDIFFGALDITLFGSATCPAPNADAWLIPTDADPLNWKCPVGVNDWVELGHASHAANGSWETITIQFTPDTDIQAIMIGGPCDMPNDFTIVNPVVLPYFYIDHLVLSSNAAVSDITAAGGFCSDDVILTATLTGGAPESFQWYAEGIALVEQTSAELEVSALNLNPGVFQVTIVDEDGNCSQAEILLEEPGFVQPALTVEPSTGCAPLTVNFFIESDPANLASQSWEFGFNDGSSDAPNPTFTYTEPGFYDVTLTVVSLEGCSVTAVYTSLISVSEIPEVTFTIEPNEVCAGAPVQFIGGDAALGNCSWDFGDGEESAECPSTSHIYEEAGVYTVTLSIDLPENCPDFVSESATITVLEVPEAAFTFGPQPADAFNPEVTFSDASSGEPVSWEWQFGQEGILGSSTGQNTAFSFPGLAGFYPVQLTVSNESGCTDSTTALVEIVEFFSIYIPNAFTPDGDGINDVLQVQSTGLDESAFEIDVFDRWGGKVFSSTDPDQPWLGNRNGGEYFLPDGVYAYRVKARPLNSLDSRYYEGCILLIR